LQQAVLARIGETESGEQPAILSLDRAVGEKGWRLLAKYVDTRESVKGRVLGFNRGGAIVEVEGVHGFVPASQLVSISRDRFRDQSDDRREGRRQEPVAPSAEEGKAAESAESAEGTDSSEQAESPKPEPNTDIGRVLDLKVLEINRSRNRAIFSERQYVEQIRNERKAKLIEELKEGEVRRGRVTGISSFGAFVDMGGADGLVHVSEMSWGQVDRPDQIVSLGQELDVYVLRVDPENKKIALSLKRLRPEPWKTIHEKLAVHDVVDATITKLTNFGAFARVEGSVEGLVHISELTDRVVQHPREVVREGDKVRLKVLRIEPERRRLGLSLKQADDDLFSTGWQGS
ncbi:MAG: S1 RNA-binding domain-containing protein, partial [Dehalococcoidia bacterium]|nr:S1 RNA-binding domain-containing protein [Dehalococcoidia bacterium]